MSKAANPLYLEEEKPAPLLDTKTMCVKFLTMPRNAILVADVLGHILRPFADCMLGNYPADAASQYMLETYSVMSFTKVLV